MTTLLKKLLLSVSIITVLGGTPAFASETPSINAKSSNPDISYHWCNFYADSEDNCVENGYTFITRDQDGEVYVISKTYSKEDDSKNKYLVVTKGDIKNIIQVYQVTDQGLKSIDVQSVYYIDYRPLTGGGF